MGKRTGTRESVNRSVDKYRTERGDRRFLR